MKHRRVLVLRAQTGSGACPIGPDSAPVAGEIAYDHSFYLPPFTGKGVGSTSRGRRRSAAGPSFPEAAFLPLKSGFVM
jgi:hypothetical protein